MAEVKNVFEELTVAIVKNARRQLLIGFVFGVAITGSLMIAIICMVCDG